MSRDSTAVRLGTVVLGLLIALGLAEGILQLGALVVQNRARDVDTALPAGSDRRVVLCVGDSFTYGSGSSSAATSYPGRLESWLNETAPGSPAWVVCNAGWPGRNSTELVRRLPRFLRETQPDYVCVLIGLNNRWNLKEADDELPEAIAGSGSGSDEPDSAEGTFRWRLPRLLAIVGAAVRERFGDEDVRGEAPGDAAVGAGGPANAGDSERTGGSASTDDLARAADSGADPLAALDEIWTRRADASDVGPLLEALQALRPRIREMHDPELSTALVMTLADMNLYEDAEEDGRLALEELGRSPALANALVRPLARLGHEDEAIELGRYAVADAPDDPDRLRRLGIALRMGKQHEEAIRTFTRGFAVTGDRTEYEKQLRKVRDRSLIASPERCEAVLAELDLRPAEHAAALASLETIRAEKTVRSIDERLLRDLRRARELVEAAGARLVLVTYPSNPTASPVLRRFAGEEGVPIADVEPVFKGLITDEGRDRYLIPDGHCNDRGYAVMAERVGELLRRLEPAPSGTS